MLFKNSEPHPNFLFEFFSILPHYWQEYIHCETVDLPYGPFWSVSQLVCRKPVQLNTA